jgi:hypothetical protein
MQITSDQRKDIESFLRAVLTEAYRQADLVGAFLVNIGFCPPPHRRRPGDTRALPEDMLLKLGALVRIYQWEQADMMPHLRADLPSSEQLLDDIRAETQGEPLRFSGEQVNRDVLKAFLRQIAWTRIEGTTADLALVPSVATEQLLDRVAKLLWRYRHLGEETDPLALNEEINDDR